MPNAGSMPLYDFAAGPGTITPFYHDHVAVALGNDEYNGDAGSLPATISVGANETHTYTFPQAAGWVMGDMHAVGMLVNNATDEILNAGKASIDPLGVEKVEADFGVKAYPNPTQGATNLQLDLQNAGEVSVSVMNMMGEVVYTSVNDLAAGSFMMNIDLSNEASGMYFANIVKDGVAQTVKINLSK